MGITVLQIVIWGGQRLINTHKKKGLRALRVKNGPFEISFIFSYFVARLMQITV